MIDLLTELGYKGCMEHSAGKVGQQVFFGRKHGEKTLGVIIKINPTKFKVKQMEDRGSIRDYPIGTLWGVPASLCTLVDANAPLLPVTAPVRRKRRTRVTTEHPLAWSWRTQAREMDALERENRAMARAERD